VQQLSQVFDGYQQAAVGLRRIRELLNTPISVPAPGANAVPVPERLRGRGGCAPFRPGGFASPAGRGAARTVPVQRRHREQHQFRRTRGVAGSGGGSGLRVGALAAIAALPHGFRQPVGERGQGLSAGQRELIALARAELVDPDVLLLDEATGALDPATESAVLAATDRLAAPRTTVVIAHRLATAAKADRIVVLEGGRIVGQGHHLELLAMRGFYARLWTAGSPDGPSWAWGPPSRWLDDGLVRDEEAGRAGVPLASG
jgi:hypothetical protein